MPTYEFQCPQGHAFDVFQSMKAAPVAPCPECGQTARRQISAGVGLIFKGTGFYITDYKSKSKPSDTASTGDKPQAAPPTTGQRAAAGAKPAAAASPA